PYLRPWDSGGSPATFCKLSLHRNSRSCDFSHTANTETFLTHHGAAEGSVGPTFIAAPPSLKAALKASSSVLSSPMAKGHRPANSGLRIKRLNALPLFCPRARSS